MNTGTMTPRPSLLDGLLTEEELEAQTGWKWRTRLRREAKGLPLIKIGADKWYPADGVRAWILAHESRPEPVRRGRPRKIAG